MCDVFVALLCDVVIHYCMTFWHFIVWRLNVVMCGVFVYSYTTFLTHYCVMFGFTITMVSHTLVWRFKCTICVTFLMYHLCDVFNVPIGWRFQCTICVTISTPFYVSTIFESTKLEWPKANSSRSQLIEGSVMIDQSIHWSINWASRRFISFLRNFYSTWEDKHTMAEISRNQAYKLCLISLNVTIMVDYNSRNFKNNPTPACFCLFSLFSNSNFTE